MTFEKDVLVLAGDRAPTFVAGGGLLIVVTGVSTLATSTGKSFNTWYNFPQ